MSTSKTRLVKERAAGKISPAMGMSMPSGKENPRPTSRVRAATHKPVSRPMARIDKSAAEESRACPRSRKSASSVPRGRSSSPYEFTRVLSDSGNNSRVSLGPPQKKVNSSFCTEQTVGKYNLRNRVSKGLEKNDKSDMPVEKNCGNGRKEAILSSIAVSKLDIERKAFKNLGRYDKTLDEIKAHYQEAIKTSELASTGFGAVAQSSSGDCKMATKTATSKYPSKLHEKLAFLEGKVKRIASEIKRTKEMLDNSNSDTSKMTISSILEKISGIEKAMGVTEHDGQANMVWAESGEDDKDLVNAKSSINGLNVDELEGRLFPHDKLIRDRNIVKIDSVANKGEVIISFDACLSKSRKVMDEVQEGDDDEVLFADENENPSMNVLSGNDKIDSLLMADENVDDVDGSQERKVTMIFENEIEENRAYELTDIGSKMSTGGWFVSEGESVLLAHDDGSCSFYDVINSEEKALYKPPHRISPNMWRDCWLIRAPSADGCSGKYVIAASAGNSLNSGFCSWDFYTERIRAFHLDDETYNESRRWWYKPCGPLIMSAACCEKVVQIFDIRDGDRVMRWELPKPVMGMDYSSPLQWRSKGKVVIAGPDALCLWDLASLHSRALMSVSFGGGPISALHVNNSDAEVGGGVRQRISSSDAEGNDGVFCTPDSISVLDFRQPSGIALKIPKSELNEQSAFSHGDSIYIGCTNNLEKQQPSPSQILQFSLRKKMLMSTYTLPEPSAALTQVWGNSSYVMGVCGLGLFVFDSTRDGGFLSGPKEIIGPDDMYVPSFDYSGSRVLVISRDRPACWRYLF